MGTHRVSRPNILFICTDQQRYDSLGCYGNPHIHTPTIDTLARDGVLFERCYVQNPVCAPSRASLVTGQYPHNHGLWGNGVALPSHHPLFSRALADSGYTCGMVGKMHLASCFGGRTEPRLDDGYAYYRWAHDPSHTSPENDYHRWLEATFPELYTRARENGRRVRHQPAGFDTIPTEGHYSRWASERAISFLEQERGGDEPFFLWLNFYDPHHPFVAPQEYLERYDPDALPDPVGYEGELETKPSIQRQASAESYAGHARGYTAHTPREIKEVIAAYYAMVSLIDDETKRILDRLDELGLADDTIVIFTSDHGEMLGDHQLLLKGPMLYDAAVRVPLILRWPGKLPAGERRSEIVQWIDLTSTFTDLAGLEPMQTAQGMSLLPLARGDDAAASRGWALCEYLDSGHAYDPPVYLTMLRTGDHKLILQHGPPATARERSGELYDLAADPNELVNLWDDPGSAGIRIELERMLLDVLVATGNRSQPREAHW
ncbi:MAG TPA: sulfatase-like hydrolase/transferase [Thermomicrobiales bacterium]|nr:sulfatase-like hydrolase/transferase [Thermomicrobiales bacterium]